MREIIVLSGKGGTGKTSLTAAFAHLAQDTILCDLDVDTPDLHLLLQPSHTREEEFWSGNVANIRPEQCSGCGRCREVCRFRAIHQREEIFTVDPLRCEGCKVCVTLCPEEAIAFPEKHCGTWYISSTRFGPLVHAQLFPGEENSGRLVALLKNSARELARQKGMTTILSDGAPGVGCPVISALSGASVVVLVTEPTVSGHHDLERVAALCSHFRVPATVIINRADLNEQAANKIAQFCREKNYPLLAQLPYDPVVTTAMVQGKAITELGPGHLARAIRQAWEKITLL